MAVDVVKYEQARNYIEDGDVVFVKTKSTIIGSIIRFFTRSEYSHVGIAFWMDTGHVERLMMVEAQGGACRRIVNMSYYRGTKMDVIEAPKHWDEVSNMALARLAMVPYGWLDAIYIGFREFLLKYFGIKIKRMNFPGEICSEFVANVYAMPKRNLSPQLLSEELTVSGQKYRVKIEAQD